MLWQCSGTALGQLREGSGTALGVPPAGRFGECLGVLWGGRFASRLCRCVCKCLRPTYECVHWLRPQRQLRRRAKPVPTVKLLAQPRAPAPASPSTLRVVHSDFFSGVGVCGCALWPGKPLPLCGTKKSRRRRLALATRYRSIYVKESPTFKCVCEHYI